MTDLEAKKLLAQGIWPGESEIVFGVVDHETGVIEREYRIKPGERIPPEALKLYRDALLQGDVLECPRKNGEEYSPDQVQRAIGKQRS